MLAHRLIPLCLLPSSNRNLYSSRCLLARHCFFSHLLSASEHSLNLREAARHPVSTDLNVDTTVSGQLLLLLFFSVCPCMCMCVCVSLPFLCLCLSVRLSPFSVSVSLPLALPLSLLSLSLSLSLSPSPFSPPLSFILTLSRVNQRLWRRRALHTTATCVRRRQSGGSASTPWTTCATCWTRDPRRPRLFVSAHFIPLHLTSIGVRHLNPLPLFPRQHAVIN